MVNRIQTLRSSVAGNRPTGRAPGELFVNFPDNAFGVVNAAGTAVDLIPVRFFSTTAVYVVGDFVKQGTQLYRANVGNGPGAFTAGNWDQIPIVTAIPLASAVAPVMDGAAAVGVAASYSRGDHVHPSDTSRVIRAGDTMTGLLTSNGSTGTIAAGAATSNTFMVIGANGAGNAAFMDFHRPGAFAVHFGLDTDNTFKIGGWSMGAGSFRVVHEGLPNPVIAATPTVGDNTEKIATTAFVQAQIAASAITTINVQTFAANGTYTPTAGMQFCHVECVGGGGGGGGCAAAAAASITGGGGGGGGEYASRMLIAAQIGASKAVVIGAAGAAGAAGPNNGGAGGNTSLGATLVFANGGAFGNGASTSGLGGLGGTGGIGDLLVAGEQGYLGVAASIITVRSYGGKGGSSAWGHGSTMVWISPGLVGIGYGVGGGGGTDAAAGGAKAGGAGTAGFMKITEYI